MTARQAEPPGGDTRESRLPGDLLELTTALCVCVHVGVCTCMDVVCVCIHARVCCVYVLCVCVWGVCVRTYGKKVGYMD